jgi:photosystem II stability/assembly factor-like uncharacterized protein
MFNLPSSNEVTYSEVDLDRHLATIRKCSAVFRSRYIRRSVVACASLAAIVVTATAVAGLTVYQHASAAPKWALVSDVSPAWQVVSTSANAFGMELTCPSASTCYAENMGADSFEVTTDGGATWQQLTIASNPQLTSGTSCVGSSDCFLTGAASGENYLYSTTDGGQSWSSALLPQVPNAATQSGSTTVPTFPNIVMCSTVTSCMVVVKTSSGGSSAADISVVLSTSDGGQSWDSTQLPEGFFPQDGKCLTSASCLLVGTALADEGGAAMYSSDGGNTWNVASLPNGAGSMNSVSCSSSADCYATSDPSIFSPPNVDYGESISLLETTDGGASFSVESSSQSSSGFGDPNQNVLTVGLTSTSCVSAASCWVSGTEYQSSSGTNLESPEAFLATTSDGGSDWSQSTLPESVSVLVQVVCPDVTSCFAIGVSGLQGAGGSAVILSLQS